MESIKDAADRIPDRVPRFCAACLRWKAEGDFNKNASSPDGLQSRCRQCTRIAGHVHYHDRGGKERKKARDALPESRERERERRAARREEMRIYRAAHDKTPLGRLLRTRRDYRYLRKRARDEARASRLGELIEMLDREIARLDRENELRREPPSTHKPYGARAKFRGVYLKADGRYVVRVSVGAGQSVNGGCHATAEAARAACNALAERLLGVEGYAIERGKR